jgi:hypothetical protein
MQSKGCIRAAKERDTFEWVLLNETEYRKDKALRGNQSADMLTLVLLTRLFAYQRYLLLLLQSTISTTASASISLSPIVRVKDSLKDQKSDQGTFHL